MIEIDLTRGLRMPRRDALAIVFESHIASATLLRTTTPRHWLFAVGAGDQARLSMGASAVRRC